MTIASTLSRAAALAAAIAATSCAGTSEPGPRPARSDLPRALTTQEEQVRGSANAFSFALWQQLNTGPSNANIFVSPLSASFALGMTMNGAAGQTLDEMRGALQFGTMPLPDVDAGYKSLIQLLTTLDPSVTMQIANSIWYRNTVTINKPFLDVATSSFDATVSPLDFDDAAGSLAKINGWVDTKTNHRISSILDEIHNDDVMFLINAIYFKGGWRDKFDPAKTANALFHGVSGDHTIPLMHRSDEMPYSETSTYQAVDLPYGDSAFTMTVVLPKEGSSIDAVAASLTADSWSSLTSSFHSSPIDLSLPKMKLEWEKSLIPELNALGMRTPFTTSADFTPMSPLGRSLLISQVRQKTFVNVDEEGTEAAAVTVVGVVEAAAPIPRTMRVDRPFIFAIRERLTGTVLFLGKVVDLP
jgi:serine protease inhibitor